jgi:leucyl-tRNA synthetase
VPVVLPPVDYYEPTDTGESPLALIDWWVNVDCPECGEAAKRETDTMPNWAGSSWYYLRYLMHVTTMLLPIRKNLILGYGRYVSWRMEHTTLHLLYSRFGTNSFMIKDWSRHLSHIFHAEGKVSSWRLMVLR